MGVWLKINGPQSILVELVLHQSGSSFILSRNDGAKRLEVRYDGGHFTDTGIYATNGIYSIDGKNYLFEKGKLVKMSLDGVLLMCFCAGARFKDNSK